MPYKDPTVRREKAREYTKKWRKLHPEYRELRKKLPSYKKVYSLKTPEAARAHREIYVKIKRGELLRPDRCSRCMNKVFTEAAHTSYVNRTFIWLCRSCHRSQDARRKNNGVKKVMYKYIDGRVR